MLSFWMLSFWMLSFWMLSFWMLSFWMLSFWMLWKPKLHIWSLRLPQNRDGSATGARGTSTGG